MAARQGQRACHLCDAPRARAQATRGPRVAYFAQRRARARRGRWVGQLTQRWVSCPTRPGALPLEPELLQPIAQRVTADAESLGGPGLVAAGLAQRLLDHRALP